MTRPPALTPMGTDTTARHASWLFMLTAFTTLPNLTRGGNTSLEVALVVGFVVTGVAVTCAPVPWTRAGPQLALIILVLAASGLGTWSSGDHAIVTGPGFVVAFLWLGLHHRVQTVISCLPLAVAVYLAALVASGTPYDFAGSAFITIPIATLVGFVTARFVAENNRSRAELEAQERWRVNIMTTLAHDVRSPLTSIMCSLELVADDQHISPASRPLLEAASRQSNRILRLATGLLDVERVNQGQLALDLHDVVLADLLEEIAVVHPSVPMRLDVPAQLTVWADPERLEQVLVNLILNAARHGAPPLDISASAGAGGVEIRVRDHGAGVPEAGVPDLFTRFSSSDRAPRSVGLGLWIVRLLSEAHGGSVCYEHARPGARFIVRLPPRPPNSYDVPHLAPGQRGPAPSTAGTVARAAVRG